MKEIIKNIKLVISDVDGTLTDGSIYINELGHESKKFNVKDGMGFKLLQKAGVKVGFLSHSTKTAAIEHRAKNLGLDFCYAGKMEKVEILKKWIKQLGIEKEQVAFVGDDVNDIEAMQYSGISACPSDAIKEVLTISSIILERKGGDAAFRELVDQHLLAE